MHINTNTLSKILNNHPCFLFFLYVHRYCVFITEVGILQTYILPDGIPVPDPNNNSYVPTFFMKGNQGGQWKRASFPIGRQDKNFQVSILKKYKIKASHRCNKLPRYLLFVLVHGL